jgi:hypothetical protein
MPQTLTWLQLKQLIESKGVTDTDTINQLNLNANNGYLNGIKVFGKDYIRLED